MSGTYGRWVRAALGVSLGIVAILDMGWSLLLFIPAAFMIYTAIINYCPATLAFPSFKPEQTLKNKYPLFKSK
jgi:hypothetical protein